MKRLMIWLKRKRYAWKHRNDTPQISVTVKDLDLNTTDRFNASGYVKFESSPGVHHIKLLKQCPICDYWNSCDDTVCGICNYKLKP